MQIGARAHALWTSLVVSSAVLIGLAWPVLSVEAASKKPAAEDNAPFRDDEVSYLLIAASKGDLATVKALLKSGANPNVTDGDKMTPVMYAARKNQAEVIRELLAAGADINAKDQGGWTALMFAAKKK
jgi:uncharacterized protein